MKMKNKRSSGTLWIWDLNKQHQQRVESRIKINCNDPQERNEPEISHIQEKETGETVISNIDSEH